jgi:selenocysteine-specific elongation factor
VIIATAGHVDHGKTSLVRALTGIDTDRLPEEKRRGLTIDLGFAYVDWPGCARIGFVDVPGHHRFVATMVAGVTGVDAALIVIAADDGVMPQTREHVAILDLLSVDRGVIAITKADKVDAERLAVVSADARRLVERTAMTALPIVETSVETGIGIEVLRGQLSALSSRARDGEQRFRLAVDRSFVIEGAGVILAGPVLSGSVARGEDLVVMPGGARVSARGLRVQDTEDERASAGDRCAVQIGGRDAGRAAARRGDWLCAPDTGIASRRLDVRLHPARTLESEIKHEQPVHLHIGAADVPGRLALLDRRRLAAGEQAWGQLVLDREICSVRGDRFILRDQSARETIAGGWVVDPRGAERGRARPERLRALAALAEPTPEAALASLLAVEGGPVDLETFARRWNLSAQAAHQACAGVEMIQADGRAFDPGFWRDWRAAALKAVATAHREHPERLGLDAPGLAATMGRRVVDARLVLATLVEDDELALDFGTYRRPDHAPVLAPNDQAAWERLRPLLGDAEHPAEVAHQIARSQGWELSDLLSLLGRLERHGRVIRISRNRYLLPESVTTLARAAETAIEEGALTLADFRAQSGVGRNLAVEFLEFLDRKRMTRREGPRRILLARANEVFGL